MTAIAFLGLGTFKPRTDVGYLPHTGPTPIRFVTRAALPEPFELPPLDLGDEVEEPVEPEEEPEPEPEVPTLSETNSVSSTPEPPVVVIPEPPATDPVDDMLPDGFSLLSPDSGPDITDLSVFVNYFVTNQVGNATNAPRLNNTVITNTTPNVPVSP